MTTSGTSSTFSKVCLMELSRTRLAGENMAIGGLLPKTLKKLNGLRFTLPFLSMVDAKQMGLGATAESKYACNSPVRFSFGSNDNIGIVLGAFLFFSDGESSHGFKLFNPFCNAFFTIHFFQFSQ